MEGPAFATDDEYTGYRHACFLYDRDDLIQGFESLGYEPIDSWQITEPVHFVIVPCYPDRSVTACSDLFLRLDATEYAPLGKDARTGQALLWRSPESRIIFSRKAKPDFGPNAKCELRELAGHFGRANAQMGLAWHLNELPAGGS